MLYGTRGAPARVPAVILLLIVFACGPRGPVEGEKVVAHTVEQGETLEAIAEEYYGDPSRARDLEKFNRVDDGGIRGGDVIRVPLTPKEQSRLERREAAREPYNRGSVLVERGSYLDAAREFRVAIKLDPDFAEAHYNLGVTYQKLGSYDRAAESYRDAIRLRETSAEYRYALGAACYHMARYKDAIEWFRKALSIDDRNLKAQFSLARAYEQDAQPAKARGAWKRYLELDSQSEWAAQARARLERVE